MSHEENEGIGDRLPPAGGGNDGGSDRRWTLDCQRPRGRRDRGEATGWAALFIWAGLVLLAEATGYARDFPQWNGWAVFFTGAGVIVLVAASVRLLGSQSGRPHLCEFICGFVLLSIGLGDSVAWLWPLVLLGIGFTILRGALARQH